METAIIAAIPAIITAMIGVIKVVTNALDRIEARQEKFLSNHMSANTKALQDMARAVETHQARSELELYRLRVALRSAGYSIPEELDEER